MIPSGGVLDAIIPGDTVDSARDMRPVLRRGLRRRLQMAAMLVRAVPRRADDPALFTALAAEVEGRPEGWRTRFFDDPDVAVWLIGQPLNPAAAAPPIRGADLQALVDRLSDAAPAHGRPCFHFDTPPPHLSAALAAAAAKDGLGITLAAALPPAEQARLSTAFDAALAALSAVWPGMGATVRRHITTVVVNQGATTTSHRYFAGTVLLSTRDLGQAPLGAKGSIGELLAHEATHQTLYCLQEEGPLILPPDGSRFTSPWSGATRSLLLAAHIAPVYYAVTEYLHRLRLSGGVDEGAVARRLRAVVAGMDTFFHDGIGRPYLTPTGRALHAQVEAAVHGRRADYLAS